MVHTRALLFLVTTTAMAAMDPARFQVAGYGPQPGDLGAQVEVSGGEVMVPQPLDQDAKTKPGDAIAAKTERVQPFLIDRTAVTNAQFRRFIEDTGFQTEADLAVWSLVQKQFLRPGQKPNKMHPSNVPKHWTILKWSTWNKPSPLWKRNPSSSMITRSDVRIQSGPTRGEITSRTPGVPAFTSSPVPGSMTLSCTPGNARPTLPNLRCPNSP